MTQGNINTGILVNGTMLNNILYVDDTVVLADSLECLQELRNRVVSASTDYGLSTKKKEVHGN